MGIVRKAATAAAVSGAATRAHNRNTPSQPAAAPVPAAAPAAPAAPADDTSAKLQELADLHAKGVLSDEEFAAAKAKALGI
tara:strand:+ start:1171 stop:1413 length:243 start_codon:yes stop_codon:yes gene_type:complete